MNDKILTIIVTFNGMKWIDKCIHSVLSSSVKSDIFVVDNASSDGTPDYIATNFPQVHLVKSSKNLGFGAANNIGLQHAIDNGYDYVYLLNQDAWVKEDTFEKLISIQKQHPEYGILSPMQLQPDENHFEPSFCKEISQCNNESKICEILFFQKKEYVIPYQMIMAAHWLISKDCLNTVGGFSPAFFHYGEDTNYAERARKKGYKVGICSTAKAIHDTKGRSSSEEKNIFFEYSEKIVEISGYTYSIKHVIWRYTHDFVEKTILSPRSFLRRLNYYIKFLLRIPSLLKIKKHSLEERAFLKKNELLEKY